MTKEQMQKMKIAYIINIIIAILTVLASIIMFTGFKFMHGVEPVLETTKIGMFRFFTVDSNVFMGIVALVIAIQERKFIQEKIQEIPTRYYRLKLMATTGVGLTFFIVIVYLGPISAGGIPSMLRNSNLFFHLLIPLMSILNFTVFEKTDKLRLQDTLVGLIPTALYACYYLSNVLIHMENGKVSTLYDWYWFVQSGVWTAVIVVPIIFVFSYLISLFLWSFP